MVAVAVAAAAVAVVVEFSPQSRRPPSSLSSAPMAPAVCSFASSASFLAHAVAAPAVIAAAVAHLVAHRRLQRAGCDCCEGGYCFRSSPPTPLAVAVSNGSSGGGSHAEFDYAAAIAHRHLAGVGADGFDSKELTD